MRPQIDLRAGRACAAVAALGLTCATVSDVATSAHAAAAAPPPAAGVSAVFATTALHAGQAVRVRGRLAGGQAGVPVSLQFRTASGPWQTLRVTDTTTGGAFALSAPLVRSGVVQVLPAGGTANAAVLRGLLPASSAAAQGPSTPVSVAARLAVTRRSLDVLAGQWATVRGALHPAVAGREVMLQEHLRRRWATVARTRTDRLGRYRLRVRPSDTGSHGVRVRFGGDAANAAARRTLGLLNSYREAGASWYSGGGTTACGGSVSGLGVANKTLPCGTLVTLRYGGRTVRVPVIDRGPYVAGRDYDLTPATKAALGFGDTGTLWATA